MGIETDSQLGGSGMSFMAAILVVEELAKVDPSVSVACDVQNTLVNTLFKKYGSAAHQNKYLPLLASNQVGNAFSNDRVGGLLRTVWIWIWKWRVCSEVACWKEGRLLFVEWNEDVDHQFRRGWYFLNFCKCRSIQRLQRNHVLYCGKVDGHPSWCEREEGLWLLGA